MAYFTATEFRNRYTKLSAEDYSDADIEASRDIAEEAIERECGIAFEPRTATETLIRDKSGEVRLANWPVRSLTSITVNGGALTVGDYGVIDKELISPNVAFTAASNGLSTIAVVYSHGYDAPPDRIKRAAMSLTYFYLVAGPMQDRSTRELVAAPDLGVDTVPVSNWPREVEAAIQSYRMPTVA